jgi:hypothetical protein
MSRVPEHSVCPKGKVLHFVWDDHHATCFEQLSMLGHMVCSSKDTKETVRFGKHQKITMSYSNISILLP